MLKFVKGPLESIEGVAIYPIISLLIFFIFFTALFWWVFTARKDYITKVSDIPLELEDQDSVNINQTENR
ncbi:MAG: CcoQ/FixQ family Cbb3-type cytochrome c oxidase assembly chaperone [Gramella sp.]|nr:CcoQ/FixQ family Cbb3-type cytochrome c oxidase assembly chaperone [Christiangramia sp.]